MWQEPRARYAYPLVALVAVLSLPSCFALVETTSVAVAESEVSATPIANPKFGLAAGGYMNFDVEFSGASPRCVYVCSVSTAGVSGSPDSWCTSCFLLDDLFGRVVFRSWRCRCYGGVLNGLVLVLAFMLSLQSALTKIFLKYMQ